MGFALLALGPAALVPARAGSVAERVRIVQSRPAPPPMPPVDRDGRTLFSVGGWSTWTAIGFTDDDHLETFPDPLRRLSIQDLRLWLDGTWRGRQRLYGRVRLIDLDFRTAPGVGPPDTRQQEGVELDLLHLDISATDSLRVRWGRLFVQVGRGLALANDLDGADLHYDAGSIRFRLFAGRTLDRQPNVDTSIVGFDEAGTHQRIFRLASMEHQTEGGTLVHAYVLWQQDRSRSLLPAQELFGFHYDSRHIGIGIEGTWGRNIHYYAELVDQGGRALVPPVPVLTPVPQPPPPPPPLPPPPPIPPILTFTEPTRVDVDAIGILAGLDHHSGGALAPRLSLEYAFGSGDPTRASVTDTFGGKTAITPDTNFLYFGVFDGGLALSPRLSNLHVLGLGLALRVLPGSTDSGTGKLTMGLKVRTYLKDTLTGAISDLRATAPFRHVGLGLDLQAGYRPLTDLSLVLAFGLFQPGSSFPAPFESTTSRLLASSTLSF